MTLIAVMMALSALVAWGVAEWVHHRAEVLRLVQAPNHRSSHVLPTPNGGGLGIVVAGSLAGIALVLFSGWTFGWFVLGLSALLAAGRAPARHVARCRRQHAMAGPISGGFHRVATVGVLVVAVGVCTAGDWYGCFGCGKAGACLSREVAQLSFSVPGHLLSTGCRQRSR
jgi:UDP-N-acetylmuramyl pentapeptide phosphotransferase/UDP-N-acetylglucosamine-1-phosphate transferase